MASSWTTSIECMFWVLFRFFVMEGLQEKVRKEYSVTSTLYMRSWKPASSWTMAYRQRMCVFPLSISFYLLIPRVPFLICIKQINTDDSYYFFSSQVIIFALNEFLHECPTLSHRPIESLDLFDYFLTEKSKDRKKLFFDAFCHVWKHIRIFLSLK